MKPGKVSKGKNRSRKDLSRSNKAKIKTRIQNVDRSDLLADYDYWPTLGIKTWKETEIPALDLKDFHRVILAGMGGSLLTGELLVDLARETRSNIQFETIKDYHLPDYCDERTLVIGMSSSGNTEETLSILSEAHRAKLKGIAFGTGGTLESWSRDKWDFNFVRTSMLKVPRSSLPGIFYAVLKFLCVNKLLSVPEEHVEESIEALNLVRGKVGSSQQTDQNESLAIARKLLKDKPFFPLIYSSNRTRSVGLRFRQSINENSKIHAFNGEIPELCHNEIVGWDAAGSSIRGFSKTTNAVQTALFLRLEGDDPVEVRTRFNIVEDIVRMNKGEIINAPSLGKSYLARILSMLYYLDYATYYLAVLRGIDPTTTPSLDLLKHELASKLRYLSSL